MRHTRIVLAAALLAGAPLGWHVSAAPKPVESTYYFHGSPSGNVADLQAAAGSSAGYLPMDAKAPTSPVSSDFAFGSVSGNPSARCVGDPKSMFPTWTGKASGTLTKRITIGMYARSLPGGRARVNLYKDLPDEALCDGRHPKPFATVLAGLSEAVTAPLPVENDALPIAGMQTITLLLSKPVVVKSSFTVQFQPEPTIVPVQGSSIVYDGAPTPSGVTWYCLPPKGKKAC
jgi:hypothetical protein